MNWKSYQLRLNWIPSGRLRYLGRGTSKFAAPIRRQLLEDNDLWYFWAGSGTLFTRSGRIALRPGVCIWARPGWTYETIQNDNNPIGLTFIHFALLDIRGKPSQPPDNELPSESLLVDDPVFVDSVTAHIAGLCQKAQIGALGNREQLEVAADMLRALLMTLTATVADNSGGSVAEFTAGRPVIHEMIRRIHANPHTLPSVDELARKSGYTRQHLTRLFHAVTGMSAKQYLVAARIARARQLLSDKRFSVAQVATECGYDDPFHFSRQFRSITGTSPSAFQRLPIQKNDEITAGRAH